MQVTTESPGAAQKSADGDKAAASPRTPEAEFRASDALAGALERVGDRWSLLVVDALAGGPCRFADLQGEVPGIATNVLAQRLRRLEADRIVLAVPYSRRPLRYAYELTEEGRALGGAARVLAQWNSDHAQSGERTPSHEACGTPMEARWYCPTCDRLADAAGDDVVWV